MRLFPLRHNQNLHHSLVPRDRCDTNLHHATSNQRVDSRLVVDLLPWGIDRARCGRRTGEGGGVIVTLSI